MTLATLNDDRISVRGCSYIYAPKGQALEYAPLAANPYRGCGHKCAYCYVPLVTKQERPEFDAGAVPRADYLKHLRRDAQKYQALGIKEQVFLSFTTDVYNPTDMSLTTPTIETLIEHGLAFCTLTKGGSRALRDLALFRPDCDAFASTLTTLDDKFSKKWERGAQLPGDRIATLRTFHDAGIFTWVSLEPTLDIEASLAIVDATLGAVDLFKVGRANYLKEITRTTDWKSYTHRMIQTLTQRRIACYIKIDLQPFLPSDFPNPLRIAQNNSKAAKAERLALARAQAASVSRAMASGTLSQS